MGNYVDMTQEELFQWKAVLAFSTDMVLAEMKRRDLNFATAASGGALLGNKNHVASAGGKKTKKKLSPRWNWEKGCTLVFTLVET